MNKVNELLSLGAFCAFVCVALSGCLTPPMASSAPANFYRIEYVADKANEGLAPREQKVLLKVDTSAALRSPRMILARSDYQLAYQENYRWAEPLQRALGRELAAGLREYFLQVETPPLFGPYKPDVRINVSVEKLWASPNGEVVLSCHVSVLDEAGALLNSFSRSFTQNGWRNGNYEDFARRTSALLPELARAIAEAVPEEK